MLPAVSSKLGVPEKLLVTRQHFKAVKSRVCLWIIVATELSFVVEMRSSIFHTLAFYESSGSSRLFLALAHPTNQSEYLLIFPQTAFQEKEPLTINREGGHSSSAHRLWFRIPEATRLWHMLVQRCYLKKLPEESLSNAKSKSDFSKDSD